MAERLNALNYLNAVFYAINVFVTYGIGVLGLFGIPNNTELSDKYITLITPAGTAFSIWAVIFIFQLIFTIVQFLPAYRASDLVQKGVSYWYCVTCATQASWALTFGLEQIELSLVFIILIWLSLVAIVFFQYYVAQKQQPNNTLLEFWLLRFPFAIHCGWVTCATVLNVSVVIVKLSPDDTTLQLATGIVSLAALHAVAVWVIFALDRPNFTIGAVIAWASYFINVELSAPIETLENRFSETVISSVQYAAFAVSMIVLGQIVVRLVLITGVTKLCFNPEEKQEANALTEESQTDYQNMSTTPEIKMGDGESEHDA